MIMIYFSGSISSLVSVTVSDVARLFEVFSLLTPFVVLKSNGRLQCGLEVQELMQIPFSSCPWSLDDAKWPPGYDLSHLTSLP